MAVDQVNITIPTDSEDHECVAYNARLGTVYSPPGNKDLESLNNASVLRCEPTYNALFFILTGFAKLGQLFSFFVPKIIFQFTSAF